MSERVLLTGATGLLGTEIASELMKTGDCILYALVRAEDEEGAGRRLASMWHHDSLLEEQIGKRIVPLCGDFTVEDLGLDGGKRELVLSDVTTVIHAGAQVLLQKSREEIFQTNVEGTRIMTSFAAKIRNLRKFVFVSTAYVAGKNRGIIYEDAGYGSEFSTAYEKSKAEAEKIVRESSLPYAVCRPSMIVGNSKTGWTRNFNTVYYLLKLLLTGKLKLAPVSGDYRIDMIPSDLAAESVVKIALSEESAGKTFHITCPKEMMPKASELADHARVWAWVNLKCDIKRPLFREIGALESAGLKYNERDGKKRNSLITNLLALYPYFSSDRVFDRTNTDAVCGRYDLSWPDYMDRILEFACRKNFMNQTGDTVFEQAFVRNKSRRHPVTYFDVTKNGIRKTSGKEANQRIRLIAKAMAARGIKKGDRIALTGINSVDYMTIDHAIGLLGAVSVPIYYTTPAGEIDELIENSGAGWFFIGDGRIMKEADLIRSDVNMVAFSDALGEVKTGVMTLDEFTKTDAPGEIKRTVYPSDLATIRYTSGTTGTPKGVTFSYGQLSWMGEVLTNLLDFSARNRSMRYMSFLPLSHVVEGILASYAPYYVLAKVEYYYLNDFASLAEMLPKVRPNVFFSVPRFYEKLWDQLAANPAGKRYLKMKDGRARRALAAVLKKMILKKSGLDRCGQLIVGSAPMSEELMLKFRELGIEIYNAYGQCEAPLITINRMGDNVIPSVGTPLPETKVEVAEDGELIVRGPQVSMGYYGLESESIKNGVLMTGDLGSVDENGHVTLYGRKKEMIVTAYGKNISIPKIEERLKNIQGVSEAVLIGENRPYVTALVWANETDGLEQEIEKMNEGLSHPEQIRKFRVIDTPLSIKKGELTPNLKVKRRNVYSHYSQIIEEMYE